MILQVKIACSILHVKKRIYRHFGKHRESEYGSPHKLCPQKIAFEIRLGFENLEIYTLKALWECYTDLLFAMGKHLGHNETIEHQIPVCSIIEST